MIVAILGLVLSATPACPTGECLYLISSSGAGLCRPCSGGSGSEPPDCQGASSKLQYNASTHAWICGTEVATATTIEGVWIGPTAPADPVTYADWLTNGHVGHWGWINTTP